MLKRSWTMTRRVAQAALGCMLLVLITPLAYFYGSPLRSDAQPKRSDVIVLLSSGMINMKWLSTGGAQRTLGALRLYREGFGAWIVSSGSNPEQGAYQAELQSKLLINAGVPADRILVENRSHRTYESGVEIARLMQERHWKSAVIVTSEMDVPRVRGVFERLGVEASYLAVPEFSRPKGPFYFREGVGVFYHATYEYAGIMLYKMKGWM